ncbi:MupA/Atu3671 family FMN-dependent luciferase-like monooxygenase [Kitasatospora viridis]|uniref:Natural product biosynthesis luciferase-like monooxygenase protein n=1 Tax=Kitasatospora viridis TaxID=281105 RepID=A0A561SG11_9ACTN|nr:MupA/Atu3671 family FMN-dependent luciferase-like monooxygenase [Kitasatospora viridis]TWF73802.1 natural product biosynthesis luciferase-like monooxygenase protein [Kitasatospora viridis]
MAHGIGLYFFSALADPAGRLSASDEPAGPPPAGPLPAGAPQPDDRAAYRLLLDAAVSADEQGLDFVWLPERHFTPFGGGHPNPAVLAAALAVRTTVIRIRAGSVVLPLHDPLRVAEEWAVVDNLSDGRVEVSSATGWNPRDFVLAPDGFADRADRARENWRTVQDLWARRPVTLSGPGDAEYSVLTYPRPVQPSLPHWITAGGSPGTFVHAGEVGAGLLTGYGTFAEERLVELIGLYRDAFAAHHGGRGRVSLMVHTAIGTDGARTRREAEGPLRRYLAAYLGQQDARTDPAVRARSLDFAVQRYLRGRSLIGDPTEVAAAMRRMYAAGADELACLVDFGLPRRTVLATVSELARLRADLTQQS